MAADHLLHHEGGVSADHHHLAMGHVDDAHHAEGDGKADGREQQYGAERQAVPYILCVIPEGERAFDARNGVVDIRLQALLHRRGRRHEDTDGIAATKVLDGGDRFFLYLDGAVGGEQRDGPRLLHPGPHLIIGFLGYGGFQQFEIFRARRFQDGISRRKPHGFFRA
ncbi:hypothetical protein D3C86_1427560 [compost metagenome]